MRVYKLAAPYHRSYVDLRDSKDVIEQAVHKEVPDAKVIVKENCYKIDKDISNGDAIRIGRTLDSGELGQYCLQRATLFIGHTVETAKERNGPMQERKTKQSFLVDVNEIQRLYLPVSKKFRKM